MDRLYMPGEKIDIYSIIEIVGEGRYGIVYLVEDEDSHKYIVKQLKKDTLEENKDELFYEIETLKSLDSPKFPKFISTIDEDILGYVLEYIDGIVFEDLLFIESKEFVKDEIYQIANQLLDIVDLLHEKNIVHRDIRPPNVILNQNKELVLIDFGLARYIDDKNIREIDYWYVGDFLIHLYYTSYYIASKDEKAWYEELDLSEGEKIFLKKLMGIDGSYSDTESIRNDLEVIKNTIQS